MTQKEKTFLDQTAQRLHLTVDGESSIPSAASAATRPCSGATIMALPL